jgi:hypothetical protein
MASSRRGILALQGAMMRKKIIEGLSSLIGQTIELPTIPEEVRLLFVDWALEQYAQWCTGKGKKVAITRAEVAFPGPFLRFTANRRSFYYAWDRDRGQGIEISRREYPCAAARLHTVSVVVTGEGSASIGSVQRSLSSEVIAVRQD